MTERRLACSRRPNRVAIAASPEPVRPNRKATTSDASHDAWTVVDDWPDIVPVTFAEIDVLETFLGPLLDDVLIPHPQPQAAATRAGTRDVGSSSPQAARRGRHP